MAMNHREAMFGLVHQEWLADPAQIGPGLLLERNSRPDAGMDEQIAAGPESVVKTAQELAVRGGNSGAHGLDRLRRLQATKLRRLDAIAGEALGAAKPQPVGNEPRFAIKDAQQHFFMVAGQEHRPHAGRAPGPQPLDHLARRWPAVDQVAEEDDDQPGPAPL